LTGTSLREKNATVVGWGRTSPFNSGTIRVSAEKIHFVLFLEKLKVLLAETNFSY
jgi:hypothetical protein